MKLIDKDALLAEIKKLKGKVDDRDAYSNGWQHALRTAEIDINSLEVKEVDFDSEVNKYFKGWGNNDCHCYAMMQDGASVGVDDCIDIAKHFFELGVNASNPLTWGDMLIIHRCIKDAMNYHLYAFQSADGQQKVYEEVLKRFKEQKGE